MSESERTPRRIANAKRVLESAGYIVTPPATILRCDMADQCEYPDLHGDPGDTCTHQTRRQRHTKFGTLWLCADHFNAPLSELIDPRVS